MTKRRYYVDRSDGPRPSDVYVFVWSNGAVAVVGRKWMACPGDLDHATMIACGPRRLVRKLVHERADIAADGQTLLVPGVLAAQTAEEATDAILDFKASIDAALIRCGVCGRVRAA